MNVSERKICFVLMPFSPEFKNQWEFAFVPAIEEVELQARRADEDTLGTNVIMKDITRSINESTVIIADLTGKNPNVMYELGLAHSAKKNVIMLSQNEKDIPFDLRHIRYILYDQQDLKSLKKQLKKRLISTLQMPTEAEPDFFPELRIMNDTDIEELNYLRQKTISFDVDVIPNNAEIFFNNRLIGSPPITINVNPQANRNILSITAPEHGEYYISLTKDHFDLGKIKIELEKGSLLNHTKRIPKWLRNRRRDPDNPVLMKAIAQYLMIIGEFEDAFEEANLLLQAMPAWHVSFCVIAQIYHLMGNYEVAIDQFKKAIILNPHNAGATLSIACGFSLSNKFQNCLDQLQIILEDEILLKNYTLLGNWRIEEDSDFDPIKQDNSYGPKFDEMVNLINDKILSLKVK